MRPVAHSFLLLLSATLLVAAMATRPAADVPFKHISTDHPKVVAAAKAAVHLHNKQNNDILGLIKVLYAERKDRGAAHYTYKMLLLVHNGGEVEKYWTEILEDLGAPYQPPVYNFGYFGNAHN